MRKPSSNVRASGFARASHAALAEHTGAGICLRLVVCGQGQLNAPAPRQLDFVLALNHKPVTAKYQRLPLRPDKRLGLRINQLIQAVDQGLQTSIHAAVPRGRAYPATPHATVIDGADRDVFCSRHLQNQTGIAFAFGIALELVDDCSLQGTAIFIPQLVVAQGAGQFAKTF